MRERLPPPPPCSVRGCIRPHYQRTRTITTLCQNHWVMSDPDRLGVAFYVQDNRQYVGNCVLWWCPEGAGYTCHLKNAGLWTASMRPFPRKSDIKWPYLEVKRSATLMVDHQLLQRGARL